MKRFLLTVFTALIGLVVNAANETYFYVSNRLEAKPGEMVELAVAMKNDKPILGFQTWITLTDGIDFNLLQSDDNVPAYDANFTERQKSVHVLSLLTSATGGLSMVGYTSDGSTPFKGDDGNLFTIKLKIADDAQPGEYKIQLSNIAFTPDDMQEIEQADFEVPITIYKEYAVNVEWDETMGTVTGGGVYRNGANVKLETTPHEGYHFVKWSNGVTENPYAFTAERDLSLNAEFEANEYQIKYFVDGVEDNTRTVTAKYGSNIERAAEPTKTGYTFSGWDTELPATMPAHDITVNGTFTVNQYTLTFNLYDGAEPIVITQNYGTTVETPANPEREGYTFAGWSPAVPETMPAEDMVFTAQWSINTYKLFYKVDGEDYQMVEYTYGAKVEKATEPTKTGYTFSGWSEIPETMPAHDVTVSGTFTVNQYTFTFNLYDGAEPIVITLNYGTTIETPANPEREGYTFAGWSPAVPETMPAENLVFTAQWRVNTYKLTYIVDGEVYKEYDVAYGTEITPEETPVKEDYEFGGWEEDLPTTMPAHDLVVNGHFKVPTNINHITTASADTVTVYDLNGHLVVSGITLSDFYKRYPKGVYIVNGKKILW